jgi:hypothetical protein
MLQEIDPTFSGTREYKLLAVRYTTYLHFFATPGTPVLIFLALVAIVCIGYHG